MGFKAVCFFFISILFHHSFANDCEKCAQKREELVVLDREAQIIESLTTKNKRLLDEMKEKGNEGAITKINSNLFVLAIKRETLQNKKQDAKVKEVEFCSSC